MNPRAMLRWGASGALYLQSAIAGPKGHPRYGLVGIGGEKEAMKVRNCALRVPRTPPGPKGSNGKRGLLGAAVYLTGAYLSLSTRRAISTVEA